MTVSRRILHLLPRCIGGGPERSVLAVARETAALGVEHHQTMVVLDPPVTPTMLLQARRLGIDLVTRFDDDELCRMVEASDLVQVHFWNHPALLAMLRRVELPPCRVIVTSHVLGTTTPQILTEDVGRFGDLLLLTAPASHEAEGARAAAAAGIRVEVLPAVLDRHRLERASPDQHDGLVVGYLGSLAAAKLHPRIEELCAAVTAPNVRFVFYGSGGDLDALRRRFDAVGVGDRVEVRGPVEDIATALSGMDLFGYPLAAGTYATSDRTLQEAMWVGLAPVVLGEIGPASMVEHERTGLVVDETGYAAAIDRLASDPGLRARLGAGARDRARDRFDPSRATQRLVDLIEQVCATPRRVRPPLPGGDDERAAGFVRSLGREAGPFAVSLGVEPGDVDAAHREIAASPLGLAHGEGGIVHHRNAYPDNPHLRLWSALVAQGAGDRAQAADELAAARALGLP